jgi:uncharacterized sulfatase
MPGVNLLPLVIDGKPLTRAALYGEIFDHDVSDIDRPTASLQFRWCIDGNWKLIVPQRGKPELYDLAKDPHETTNLAEKHDEIVERLSAKIDATWKP